jgi:hypothetical protein
MSHDLNNVVLAALSLDRIVHAPAWATIPNGYASSLKPGGKPPASAMGFLTLYCLLK